MIDVNEVNNNEIDQRPPRRESLFTRVRSFVATIMKFALDAVDDIIIATKNFLPVSISILETIMGATFGVLCFKMAYDSGKNFLNARRDHNRQSMIRNFLATFIMLGAGLLSLLLIIGAWLHSVTLGTVFFPFAITLSLLAESLVESMNINAEYPADHPQRGKFYWQLVDSLGLLVILVGISLEVFFGMHLWLPIGFIIAGATLGIVGRIIDKCLYSDNHHITVNQLNQDQADPLFENIPLSYSNSFIEDNSRNQHTNLEGQPILNPHVSRGPGFLGTHGTYGARGETSSTQEENINDNNNNAFNYNQVPEYTDQTISA